MTKNKNLSAIVQVLEIFCSRNAKDYSYTGVPETVAYVKYAVLSSGL